MGISNANKELSASGIACGGSFKIKLSLTAEPNIVTNPTDIVLILDRSKSMAGSPLANLKKGAETFIDILDEATDGALNGQLGHGSRIGIVSFADAATKDTPLTATVSTLKQAVHTIRPLPTPESWSCSRMAKQLLVAMRAPSPQPPKRRAS